MPTPLITYRPIAQSAPISLGALSAPRLQSFDVSSHSLMQDKVTPAVIQKAGEQIGKGAFDYGIAELNAQSVARATEALQKADAEFGQFENDWMEKNKGKSAGGAAEAFGEYMKGIAARYGEELSGDRMASRIFGNMLGRRAIEVTRQGNHYARGENERWLSDVANGEVATLMQRINTTDDSRAIADDIANTKAKIGSMYPGRDLTAMFAKIDGDAIGNVIRRNIAQERFGQASALINQYKEQLGPNYDNLLGTLKNAQRSASNHYEYQNEKAKRKQAIGTATGLLDQFGGNTAQADSWIAENVKGTEAQLQVRSAYLQQRNILDARDAQIRQEGIIAEKANIDQRVKESGGNVAVLNDITAGASTPEMRHYAQQEGLRAMGINKRAISDPSAFAAVQDAVLQGGSFEAAIVLHRERLSDTDEERLRVFARDKTAQQNKAEFNKYVDNIFYKSKYATLPAGERAAAKADMRYKIEQETHGMPIQAAKDKAFEIMWDVEQERTLIPNVRRTSEQGRALAGKGETINIYVPEDAKKIINAQAKAQGITLTDDQRRAIFYTNRAQFGY